MSKAEPAKEYATLDTWAHSTEIDLQLSNGQWVTYRIPDLSAYIALGHIPNPLAGMALQIETEGVVASKLDDDERRTYFDLQCWIIATHLRVPNLVAELGTEQAATAWVESEMHPDDRALLWSRSVHSFDAEEVLSSIMAGLPFRHVEADADDDGDGEAIGPEAS